MMDDPQVVAAEAVIDNGSFGTRTIRFETGLVALQAAGSAFAYLDDQTTVLSATTVGKHPRDQFDFFPLTVDVEERQYAAGRIPGNFFRREGRPTTEAILACRQIDRPLRPAFVKGLRNEVQVVETVMTVHPDDAYDVLAINAASMSTQISGLPFSGPIGGLRLALIDGQWVAFPRYSEMERATFLMVVAGRIVGDDVAIMMVEAGGGDNAWALIEAGAQAPTEEVVADGLEAAKPFIRELCRAQSEVAAKAAKETREFPLFLDFEDRHMDAVRGIVEDDLKQAITIADKLERQDRVDEIKDAMLEKLLEDEQFADDEKDLKAAFKALEKDFIRTRTLDEEVRVDGRKPAELRSLYAKAQVLPRVHGSALFRRGETQVLGVTTLNMLRMEQQLDNLSPIQHKRYMHHYNFPPYCTGETGRVGTPKRREIGHGDLAERALVPVLPSREEFPYAIRQVSEIMGSNGSSSMGSVCASTISLLQAGVPLKAPVAGIAMGLMSQQIEDGKRKYLTLTDILGVEDGFGDMDFKVAGTREFITALQLDTKLDGIPSAVLRHALGQAREARLTILDLIDEAIPAPDEMSPFAPRIITVQVPVDKIGEVIGPKGKMINQIQEDTGADLTIEDDGTVYIAAAEQTAAEAARAAVNAIANPQMPEVGERFVGTVVKTTSFGAFVSLTPGKDGLLHITQIRRLVGGKRVEAVEDVLNVGDQVQVEIAEIDPRGKLSLHAVVEGEEDESAEADEPREDEAPRRGRDRGERDRDGEGRGGQRRNRNRRRRTRSKDESDGGSDE
ncbi:MAG: polyribonucleotide nucleotidyltransferase [Actinomycetaceae bacterium]|nr:polyribonucleotide nucleotidyltransferase [Actinomycetaceae bacterium]